MVITSDSITGSSLLKMTMVASNITFAENAWVAQHESQTSPAVAGIEADGHEVPGLVSVIIPTYNSAAYLEECLQSVFSQTYPHYEILVVDDGSTDETRKVLAPYIAAKRITYFYQHNQGPAAARNLALRYARGEFIAFLDSDDLWLPEKLEKQVGVLQRNPDLGMLYSDSEWFGEEWERQCAKSSKLREFDRSKAEYFRRGDIFKVLLAHNFIPSITVIVRNSVLKKTGPFLETLGGHRFAYGEDFELWLRIARRYKVDFTLHKFAKRRVHSNQITANKRFGYRQLCALYRHLWKQDYCNEWATVARMYLLNLLKRLATAVQLAL